eukprot:1060371_1
MNSRNINKLQERRKRDRTHWTMNMSKPNLTRSNCNRIWLWNMKQENILQSEIKSLEEHKLMLNTEILQLKQNEKKYLNEINDVIQSKIILIKATSSEIDALRQKIKIYTAQFEFQA